MSKTRLFVRNGASQYSASQGTVVAVPGSTGIADVGTSRDTVSAAAILAQFPEVSELGRIVLTDETMAGNSSENYTVPSGKYWRLLALVHVLTTDATVANRAVVVTTRTAADATIEALTHANVAASTVAQRTTLFGTADQAVVAANTRGVAAAGTITIAEPVTDGDSFTVGDVTYTLKNTDDGTIGNVILIGGSEAATKTNIAAVLEASNPLVTSPSSFTGDGLLVTAREESVASDSIVFVEVTLTHASNVLDGSGTLGGTTAGVDPADKVSAINYPSAGAILTPGEDINITVTNGVAGDTLTTFLVALEYDNDPR